MATELPNDPITPIPDTQPYATAALWNGRYVEIDENFDALKDGLNALENGTFPALLSAAIKSLLRQSVAALPYPTIHTADNRITITPAAMTNGGKVTIAAGITVDVCEEVVAGVAGVPQTKTTPAYDSGDLDVSSTYFIRSKIASGALVIYKQKGTDADSGWTLGWTGTPDGASGGGVDSSKFDMLIARVVTGTAGSTPTVTPLANADFLTFSRVEVLDPLVITGPWVVAGSSSSVYNWGRKPRVCVPNIRLASCRDAASGSTDILVIGTSSLQKIGVKAESFTRYSPGPVSYQYDQGDAYTGRLELVWSVLG